MKQNKTDARRPLKVRKAGFSQSIAKWLSRKQITPNQISIMSVVFALLAAVCLYQISVIAGSSESPYPISGPRIALCAFLAAVFVQCRLLCNLFDGMVAIEGGKSTASGELFNDIPDRIADPVILIALGFAASHLPLAKELGFIAALLSVLTAYVRTLASSIGAPTDFSGPMAKQHRMAVVTFACLVTAVSGVSQIFTFDYLLPLYLALIVVICGCVVTLARRIKKAYDYLENRAHQVEEQGE